MTFDRLDTAIAFAVVMLGVSLLITIVTQMMSSLFALRGSNLLWGIKTILQGNGVDPKSVDKIAREVLTDPTISDSVWSQRMWVKEIPLVWRWHLATAIRPDELSRILLRIATDAKPGDPEEQATKAAIDNALSAVDEVTHNKLKILRDEFLLEGQTWTLAADRVAQQTTDGARQSILKLEADFATIMDRVSQHFAMKMRIYTVIVAFIIAFGVHLDSLALVQQLATNPDQRNALVNLREGMLAQAKSVIPPAPSAATASPADAVSPPTPIVAPAILKEAMDNLKKNATGSNLPATPDFASYTEAANWLKSNHQEALDPRYQQAVLAALQQHAADINRQLIQGGVHLIPTPYSLWPLFTGLRNLLGILISAAFLSLGAPFWFNSLKGMSNLRSVLATNEKKETGKA